MTNRLMGIVRARWFARGLQSLQPALDDTAVPFSRWFVDHSMQHGDESDGRFDLDNPADYLPAYLLWLKGPESGIAEPEIDVFPPGVAVHTTQDRTDQAAELSPPELSGGYTITPPREPEAPTIIQVQWGSGKLVETFVRLDDGPFHSLSRSGEDLPWHEILCAVMNRPAARIDVVQISPGSRVAYDDVQDQRRTGVLIHHADRWVIREEPVETPLTEARRIRLAGR